MPGHRAHGVRLFAALSLKWKTFTAITFTIAMSAYFQEVIG